MIWLIRSKVFDWTNKLRTPIGVLLDTGWNCTVYTDRYERYVVYQKLNGKVCLLYWSFVIGDVWAARQPLGDFDSVEDAYRRTTSNPL